MVETGPLIGAILALIAGAVYTWVGRVISKRTLSGEDRRANQFFLMWWYGLAGLTFIGGAFGAAGALGYTDFAIHLVLTHVAILLLCAALWGLAYFLVYLYTGNKAWMKPLGAFYVGFYLVVDYLIVRLEPVGVEVGRWQTALRYNQDAASVPWAQWVLLLLLLPQLVGALAYFSLFFRVRDRLLRYRVAMVSGSFIVWFGSSIVASAFELNQNDLWPLASRAIGVLAAIAVLWAYRPPAWIRGWMGAPAPAAGGSP